MNELNNKKGSISTVIIVILLAVIIGLGFYIACDKGLIFNNDNNNEEIDNANTNDDNDNYLDENEGNNFDSEEENELSTNYNVSDLVSNGTLTKINTKKKNLNYAYNKSYNQTTENFDIAYSFDLLLENNKLVIENCKDDLSGNKCSTNLNFEKNVKSVYASTDCYGAVCIYYLVITTDGKLYKMDMSNIYVTSKGKGQIANSDKKPNELTFSIVEGFENFNAVDFYVAKDGELYILREDETLFNLKKVYETATVVENGVYPETSN